MTRLNDTQARLLASVQKLKAQADRTIETIQKEADLAEFKAKSPVVQAIDEALKGGVPFRQMVEALDMSYSNRLKQWMQPPNWMVQDMVASNTTGITNVAQEMKLVSRDPKTGEFRVKYLDETYTVPAMGPDDEAWSSADPNVPSAVYDKIKEQYPGWVLLEEENDD